MNLADMRRYYVENEGYSSLNATARVCQDVILGKVAASSMKDRVTVKGGVLMCALSGNGRRATQDIDLDFVRYPISDEAIKAFVRTLSDIDDGVTVMIDGHIEKLSQQDYKGKRVRLKISDGKSTFDTKLDLGVHASLGMNQTQAWFDVSQEDDGVCLLANSKEQMFCEKLGSLLRHGIRSTRFRDLYDMYYIGHRQDLDRSQLIAFIDVSIIGNKSMYEKNMADVVSRVRRTVDDRGFLSRMKRSHRDWVGKPAEEVATWLPMFLEELSKNQ